MRWRTGTGWGAMEKGKLVLAAVWAVAITVVGVYDGVLALRNTRLSRDLHAMAAASQAEIGDSAILSATWYTPLEAGRRPENLKGPVIVVVVRRACPPCKEAISAWQTGLEAHRLAPGLSVWVAGPDISMAESKGEYALSVRGSLVTYATIPDVERFAIITGVKAAPISIAIAVGGSVVAELIGVPSVEGMAAALDRLAGRSPSAGRRLMVFRDPGVRPLIGPLTGAHPGVPN